MTKHLPSFTEACWITHKGIVQDSLLQTGRYRRYYKPIVADHSSKSAKHRGLGQAIITTNYHNTLYAAFHCAICFDMLTKASIGFMRITSTMTAFIYITHP